MVARTALLVAVALLGVGCLGLAGPDPAPLPPDGEVFTTVSRGCGQQLTPHESVWITYPNRTLYHFVVAVETDRTDEDGREDPEDRRSGDVDVPYDEAIGVLAQANATGGFDLAFYERESRENGHERIDLWHAEREPIDPDAFERLRETVARADLAARDDRYTEPNHVADGCGIDLAAWTGDAYAHVYRTSGNGPDPVRALDAMHRELHPPA